MADSGYVEKAKSAVSNMTGKSYATPAIPNTPSRTINDMLHQRCGKSYDNPVKAGIAHYICYVYTFINKVYELLHKESTPSHTMWMTACGIIGVACILKVVIVYQILIASAFLVHFVLYYSAIGVALFGAGLGVAGMVFFDKDSKAATGFSSENVRTAYTSVRTTVQETAQQFSKND